MTKKSSVLLVHRGFLLFHAPTSCHYASLGFSSCHRCGPPCRMAHFRCGTCLYTYEQRSAKPHIRCCLQVVQDMGAQRWMSKATAKSSAAADSNASEALASNNNPEGKLFSILNVIMQS